MKNAQNKAECAPRSKKDPNEKTESAGLTPKVCSQNITPWVYFAGAALHALITRGVNCPESSAAHYADRMVELYAKKGGKQ